MIRAPASAEPTKYPEEAARRRMTALVAMEDEGTSPRRRWPPRPTSRWPSRGSSPTRGQAHRDAAGRGRRLHGHRLPVVLHHRRAPTGAPRALHRRADRACRPAHLHLARLRDAARAWKAVTSTLFNEDDPATRGMGGRPRGVDGGRRRPGPGAGHGGQPPQAHAGEVRDQLRGAQHRVHRLSPGRRSSPSCWPRRCARASPSNRATTPRARCSSRAGPTTASPPR